jgi:hypothetical protein
MGKPKPSSTDKPWPPPEMLEVMRRFPGSGPPPSGPPPEPTGHPDFPKKTARKDEDEK